MHHPSLPAARWWAIGLLLALSGPVRAGVPLWAYEVVARYPHDTGAYTQGLLYTDGVLYESTGQYGESSVRRVALTTGEVLAIHRLPTHLFGEGLARVADRLVQLTWRAGTAFVYTLDGLERVGHFRYPGEGWGLAEADGRLYMSNGSHVITVRDPRDFGEIDQIEVSEGFTPVTRLNELEVIDGRIWANVWRTPRIVVIDPLDGQLVAQLDLSALEDEQGPRAEVLNGIAYDAAGDRIFVTGKRWSWLYEIRVPARHGTEP